VTMAQWGSAIWSFLPRFQLARTLWDYPHGAAGKIAGDVAAGIVTTIVLLPQSLAYGSLAGLPPIFGLYTSVIGLFSYAILGTSPHISFGPTATLSLVTAGALGVFGSTATCQGVVPDSAECLRYVELSQEFAFLVGLSALVLGCLKAGAIVNFLSTPVLKGFTAASAIVIATSQLPAVLGVKLVGHSYAWYSWYEAVYEIASGRLVLPTLLISLESILFFYVLNWARKFLRTVPSVKASPLLMQLVRSFPSALLVLTVNIVITSSLHLDQEGVKIVGSIQPGIPSPRSPFGPSFQEDAARMWPTAIVTSLVGFLEAISAGKAMALRCGISIDANQELAAVGLSNTLGGFFNAFPLTGAFSRTVINAEAGAKTPVAGILTGCFLTVIIIFLAPLFEFLPLATLGSMIIFAVIGLIELDYPTMLWAVDRGDLVVYCVAFVATVGLGIEVGLLIGAGISLVRVIKESSNPHVAELGKMPDEILPNAWRSLARFPGVARAYPLYRVLRFDSPVYFANAIQFNDIIIAMAASSPVPRAIIVDCSAVSMIDSTALSVIDAIPAELEKAADVAKAARISTLASAALAAGTPKVTVQRLLSRHPPQGSQAKDFHPVLSPARGRKLPDTDEDVLGSSSQDALIDRLRLVQRLPPKVPMVFFACVPVPVQEFFKRSDAHDKRLLRKREQHIASFWSCEYPCGCINPARHYCGCLWRSTQAEAAHDEDTAVGIELAPLPAVSRKQPKFTQRTFSRDIDVHELQTLRDASRTVELARQQSADRAPEVTGDDSGEVAEAAHAEEEESHAALHSRDAARPAEETTHDSYAAAAAATAAAAVEDEDDEAAEKQGYDTDDESSGGSSRDSEDVILPDVDLEITRARGGTQLSFFDHVPILESVLQEQDIDDAVRYVRRIFGDFDSRTVEDAVSVQDSFISFKTD
jgi:sulfate permease, SulP family